MAAGRQRTFDRGEALKKALEVFWRKGFSGTSMCDLTHAMGINKPSLYAAYGNKESLFISAIKQYVDDYGSPHFEKLDNSEVGFKERLKAYLKSIASMASDAKLPGGCFVTTSTCEAGSNCLPDKAEHTILEINDTTTELLVRFFSNELAKGNISSSASPAVLANCLQTLQFGLAVMAKNGTSRDRLEQVIEHTISCFSK